MTTATRRPKAQQPEPTQEDEAPALQSLRLDTISKVRESRTWSAEKGGVTTSITITAQVAPKTAELLMQLVGAGAPLRADIGTDQTTMFPPAGNSDGEEPEEQEED